MEEYEVIVELLEEILGEPKKIYESKLQYAFDCPVCSEEKGLDHGDGKGNLEISLEKELYNCWACGEVNGTKGSLDKFFRIFGNKEQKKLYKLLKPKELNPQKKFYERLRLPEGFILIKDINKKYPPHLQGLNYLRSRGITDDIIEKYSIGLSTTGKHANRIIVPSYNQNKELNYFIARAWGRTKNKYMNPEAEKDKIIFNEYLVNWEEDIFLVEGVFDSFFLNNSIPMLGKHISKLLFETIYQKAKKFMIICLDGDASADAIKLYNDLNGGILWNRIKIVRLPEDKDVANLKGDIEQYYFQPKN